MPQKTGAELIAEERTRQMEKIGWSDEHDDSHDRGELAKAAVCYTLHRWPKDDTGDNYPPRIWPWNLTWWKPSPDPIRNLVRAGALIAAEIDRLQRAAARNATPPSDPVEVTKPE